MAKSKRREADSSTQIFACCVVVLWAIVFSVTAYNAVKGDMFISPCVNEAQKEHEKGTALDRAQEA